MRRKLYFFIDESGDPTFYAGRKRPLWIEPFFDPVLMLGMVVIENRGVLAKKILEFQENILNDPLFNTISSVVKGNWFLHASNDHVEVRLKFFEFLRQQEDIKCYVAIGRKNPEIFHNKHNGNATEFYFDLLNKLLSRFDYKEDERHMLFLSERKSNTQERFLNALEKALKKQSKDLTKGEFNCRIVASKDYPELSVIDYFLWAIKRYITTNERRYYAALENKVVEIFDIYEDEGKGRIYDKSNKFDMAKASPFEIK